MGNWDLVVSARSFLQEPGEFQDFLIKAMTMIWPLHLFILLVVLVALGFASTNRGVVWRGLAWALLPLLAPVALVLGGQTLFESLPTVEDSLLIYLYFAVVLLLMQVPFLCIGLAIWQAVSVRWFAVVISGVSLFLCGIYAATGVAFLFYENVIKAIQRL